MEWNSLTTLDYNPEHKPTILCDLMVSPLPFEDDAFDEIHAYDVLEHLGAQGDWRQFFAQFSDYWRILKPGGHLFAIVPDYRSVWAWGDPSHTRIINVGTLSFLSQQEYRKQVGTSPMSDFRPWYKADFETVSGATDGERFMFVLRSHKPAR